MPIESIRPLTPVVASKPEYPLIGIQKRHVIIPGEPVTSFAEQWVQFMQRIHEIPQRTEAAPTLGVCFGSPDNGPFDYVTGAVVDRSSGALPPGMESWTIAPNTYAIFTHRGPIHALGGTYAAIYEWLADNPNYARSEGPELEYYDHRYTAANAEDSEFDIYIPVARK